MPRVPTNVALWKFWDEHGLPDAKMIGFWTSEPAVTTNNDEVVATVYRGAMSTVVAVAGWTDTDASVRLTVDWDRLGYNPDEARVTVPAIDGIQAEGGELSLAAGGVVPAIAVQQGKGLLIVIERPNR
jgi:hypothetical protein